MVGRAERGREEWTFRLFLSRPSLFSLTSTLFSLCLSVSLSLSPSPPLSLPLDRPGAPSRPGGDPPRSDPPTPDLPAGGGQRPIDGHLPHLPRQPAGVHPENVGPRPKLVDAGGGSGGNRETRAVSGISPPHRRYRRYRSTDGRPRSATKRWRRCSARAGRRELPSLLPCPTPPSPSFSRRSTTPLRPAPRSYSCPRGVGTLLVRPPICRSLLPGLPAPPMGSTARGPLPLASPGRYGGGWYRRSGLRRTKALRSTHEVSMGFGREVGRGLVVEGFFDGCRTSGGEVTQKLFKAPQDCPNESSFSSKR